MTWTVHLSDAARKDFDDIIDWTIEHFGEQQALIYAEVLAATLEELDAGLQLAGVKARADLGRGIHTLHVARHGRKSRHFVILRGADHHNQVIEVARLLHDAMDLPRHLPAPR